MPAPPPEATEGERLARLEAIVEALVREVGDIKADIRDLRTMMNWLMLAMIAMWITTMLTILASAILVRT